MWRRGRREEIKVHASSIAHHRSTIVGEHVGPRTLIAALSAELQDRESLPRYLVRRPRHITSLAGNDCSPSSITSLRRTSQTSNQTSATASALLDVYLPTCRANMPLPRRSKKCGFTFVTLQSRAMHYGTHHLSHLVYQYRADPRRTHIDGFILTDPSYYVHILR